MYRLISVILWIVIATLHYEGVNGAVITQDWILWTPGGATEVVTDINIDEPGHVVWRKTEEHQKKSSQITKEWDHYFEEKQVTKENVYEIRDHIEKKVF